MGGRGRPNRRNERHRGGGAGPRQTCGTGNWGRRSGQRGGERDSGARRARSRGGEGGDSTAGGEPAGTRGGRREPRGRCGHGGRCLRAKK